MNGLQDYLGGGKFQCVPDSFIALYGNDEYEVLNMKLEEAIEHVKQEDRYKNYGHNGAMLIGYRKVYSISDEVKERTFV